jgi:hypothetical protein
MVLRFIPARKVLQIAADRVVAPAGLAAAGVAESGDAVPARTDPHAASTSTRPGTIKKSLAMRATC